MIRKGLINDSKRITTLKTSDENDFSVFSTLCK